MVMKATDDYAMIDDAYVGRRIRQGRKNMKPEQTQGDLAEAVSKITGERYTQDQVSRWEHGMGLKPSILQAIRLAQGQPLRFYYGGEGTTEPIPGQSPFEVCRGGGMADATDLKSVNFGQSCPLCGYTADNSSIEADSNEDTIDSDFLAITKPQTVR